MTHSSRQLITVFTLLMATSFAVPSYAAAVYRWVDKQGKTHFGDAVPSEYRDVAKPVRSQVVPPSANEKTLAAEQAARATPLATSASAPGVPEASDRRVPQPPNATPNGTPNRPVESPTQRPPKRPTAAPTDSTDCATWGRLYRESLACFGPYRTARGATKAEAFEHCTPVAEPPQRCGRNAP